MNIRRATPADAATLSLIAEEGTGIAGFYQIDTRKEPPWLDHLWIDPQYMR